MAAHLFSSSSSLRQTHRTRDRFIFRHLLRHTEAETEAKFGDASPYPAHLAHVLVTEMYAEYVALAIAPALVLGWARHSPVVDVGVPLGGAVDLGLLGASVALQLVAELGVDTLCWTVEERLHNVPLSAAWAGRSKRFGINAAAIGTWAAFFTIQALFKFVAGPCQVLPTASLSSLPSLSQPARGTSLAHSPPTPRAARRARRRPTCARAARGRRRRSSRRATGWRRSSSERRDASWRCAPVVFVIVALRSPVVSPLASKNRPH